MKELVNLFVFLFVTIGAFGGGALYWIGFCLIFGISGTILEVGCAVSAILISIVSFYLAFKFNDRIF